MNIKGKKITLRAIEPEDLILLHKWSNDPDICYQMADWNFPGSKAGMEKWLEKTCTDELNQHFAVDSPDLGLIGTTNLIDIDWKNNHAFHEMLLGDKDIRGRGYGIETIMTVMRYTFEELHLARLDGAIIEYNQISVNVYCDKCGWKEEGRLRNWFFRKNRYWDKVIVGITRDDYKSLMERTDYWNVR